MKKIIFLLLACYWTSFGQNPAIEIKIDTITSLDSIPSERTFIINYHIENLTDKEVSFFLNPTSFLPNSRASMARVFSYKIYRNLETMDMDNVFINKKAKLVMAEFEKAQTEEEKKAFFKKYMDTDLDASMEELLLKDLLTLKSREVKQFSKTLLWDKKRYFKIDDVEYYIDETIPHYFELSVHLMKEEFKVKLSSEAQKIITDPSLIQGWFTSNKVEINFKE